MKNKLYDFSVNQITISLFLISIYFLVANF